MQTAFMKSFISLLLLVPALLMAQTAETPSPPQNEDLMQLQSLALGLQTAPTEEARLGKCYEFIPALVGYLKKQSVPYQTDLSSLEQISVLEAPDQSFKILSWAVELDTEQKQEVIAAFREARVNSDKSYKYFGAILFNEASLKLMPLTDKSNENIEPEDGYNTNKDWYGCVYYNISQKTLNGQAVYSLFGWDGATGQSTRKVMDLLTFGDDGSPIFGLPIIDVVRDDSLMVKYRFLHEYRSGSGVSLNYDKERDIVVFDFIEAPDEESKGIYPTYIPDGTYAGLEFKNDRWTYVRRVYQGQDLSSDALKQQRQQIQGGDKETSKKKKRKKR